MKTYRIYIVKCNDASYYIGVTNNLEKRIQEHNYGSNIYAYTFNKRPVTLVYSEETQNIKDAIQREKQLKGRSRKKKELLIQGDLDELTTYGKD